MFRFVVETFHVPSGKKYVYKSEGFENGSIDKDYGLGWIKKAYSNVDNMESLETCDENGNAVILNGNFLKDCNFTIYAESF